MADVAEKVVVDGFLGLATLTAVLEVRTGLHIGAGKDTVEIGGIDNPVIKTPAGDPYVPGSSIKGKMRFLLEWAFGKVRADGKAWGWEAGDCTDPRDPVLRIFGTNAKREAWDAGPTRLLVRDAMLLDEWRRAELDAGRELTEAKTEVVIHRIAGKALDNVGPRQTERVPPGARFAFEAAFRVYSVEGDGGARDLDCLAWAIQGLRLIEEDALGGSGSRGYGRVAFRDLVLRGPGGAEERLDNLRGGAFSRAAPDPGIREAVARAFGAG
ncbi:type III-A CRISPR-associated RAMP protein Csm3 [Rubellimicrobium sp. CFH 75288]|uniref:type III-A CRISPR-associated RAMP protein Csm3 n=1 Tax=Rubellimicrobium sp. CFH 75288 TaxID=2697034 RepID=UPI001411C5C3|nr:type III-A CRISPR-associated RAMP protein Csm3 [Rubellimicrobium sp. CFH 75288]NAZ37431.1 type III-A CRISPR-associated RAMP protein Csm3 [Rubellimicrobium sp. CFH 75288]